jgi:DNA polymerase-3 subunit delta'
LNLAFRDIAGQPQAVRILQKSLRDGRVAHAYLFSGIDGVGKTSCAISLAQVLNCEKGGEDGCGRCPACQKIARLNFPDFRKIEPGGPARTITIDTIRGLRREIYLRPVEGNYKIFLITGADRMNEQSSNALLKVLEEPPEESILILTTSYPHLLLPTILSRCQTVCFRRLNREKVVEILRSRLDISEREAEFAAGLSEGSLGKALSLLERGLEEREKIISWLKKRDMSVEDIFSIAERIAARSSGRRERLLWFLEVVLSWYRDLFMIVAGNPALINEDCAQELREEAESLSGINVQEALETVLRAQEWINMSANPRLTLEVMLLNLKGDA